MSKRILIVEGDAALSRSMRSALEAKGFQVEETSDGKGSIELIRRQKPELVLLAVELPAGQNGYILCGKLKKDDELKAVPIVIVGNPDGFAQHRKLKTRADEYVAKPLDPAQVVQTVGGLIGFPEAPHAELVDESLSLSDLVEDTGPQDVLAEEISVENPDEATVNGDPELDMLDAAFDDMSTIQAREPSSDEDEPLVMGSPTEESDSISMLDEEEPVHAPLETAEDDFSGLDSSGEEPSTSDALDSLGDLEEDDGSSDKTMVMQLPPPAPAPVAKPAPVAARPAPIAAKPAPIAAKPAPIAAPPSPVIAPAPPRAAVTSAADAAELRNLRARVAELQGTLEEANQRISESDTRAQQLEQDLHAKEVELETARSSSGKNDKEFFTLRESVSRKDKEILRLKTEINDKDKELVELRDREMQLEQQATEAAGETARRDAQIKTLTTRVEQLTTEKRKSDQQLLAANQEARSATAKLTAIQTELDQAHAQLDTANSELEQMRSQFDEMQTMAQQAQEQTAALQTELEELRTGHEDARREADEVRAQLEQTHQELDTHRTDLVAHQEEGENLRRQLAEQQESSSQHEERLTKLYRRMKADEQHREKARKALAVALQLLDEQAPSTLSDGADDEPAVA